LNNKVLELQVNEDLIKTSCPLPFRWGVATHTGKVRQENQDTFFTDPALGLFLLSDGMGGHRGGALASKIITEDLPVMIELGLDRLKVGTTRAIRSLLKRSIAEQSMQMQFEGNSEAGYRDMGATIVIALLRKDRCFIANVGDSRGYLFRNGRLQQMTRDHSVISELLDQGQIEPHETENHDAQGQITRYIGMEGRALPHIRSFQLKGQDRLLLCTDGLTDLVDDKTIAEIVGSHNDPQHECNILVKAANSAGGHDNITVLVINWL
jgi:protein phosphatase